MNNETTPLNNNSGYEESRYEATPEINMTGEGYSATEPTIMLDNDTLTDAEQNQTKKSGNGGKIAAGLGLGAAAAAGVAYSTGALDEILDIHSNSEEREDEDLLSEEESEQESTIASTNTTASTSASSSSTGHNGGHSSSISNPGENHIGTGHNNPPSIDQVVDQIPEPANMHQDDWHFNEISTDEYVDVAQVTDQLVDGMELTDSTPDMALMMEDNLNSVETVYTIDGEAYTAAVIDAGDGDSMILIDVDNDDTFDLMADNHISEVQPLDEEISTNDFQMGAGDDSDLFADSDTGSSDDFMSM